MKTAKRLICLIIVISVMCPVLAVSASAAGSIAFGAGTVSATSLNIRENADTESAVAGTLSEGDIVVILEKTSADWYKINYNGTVGYVSAEYITNVLTAENFDATGVVNGTSVRMRSKPSTSSSIVKVCDIDTKMSVLGINNGWYKVNYNGAIGYIRSDLMDIVSPDSNTTIISATSYNADEGASIVEYALQYEGYKYVYGGETPSGGFDCSGFVYYIFGQFDHSLSRTASQQYKNNGESVSKSDLKPGDLVFFSSNGGKSVTHVGLYIGDNQFIHASTSTTGVIISSLGSAYYTRVWYGAKRILA